MDDKKKFIFDDKEFEFRKDIFTVKGLKDNFTQLENIPIPTKSLEETHKPYLFGPEQLNIIYETINSHNNKRWPFLNDEKILSIIPFADYLGLDILINHCLDEICIRLLIKNKLIFDLLLDYPQLRCEQHPYTSRELQYIYSEYGYYSDKYPKYLLIQLLKEGKKMHNHINEIKKVAINFNYKYDHLSLKEFARNIFKTLTGNNNTFSISYFSDCIKFLKYSTYPKILDDNLHTITENTLTENENMIQNFRERIRLIPIE